MSCLRSKLLSSSYDFSFDTFRSLSSQVLPQEEKVVFQDFDGFDEF